MKDLKNIKLLIILLTVFAVGLIATIIVLNNMQNNEGDQNQIVQNQVGQIENKTEMQNPYYEEEYFNTYEIETGNTEIIYDTTVKEVTSKSTLYNITNSINDYFAYTRENNMQAIEELGGNNTYTIGSNIKFVLKEAYATGNEFQDKYYVKGVLVLPHGDLTASEQEVYILLYVDLQNGTYKIENINKEAYVGIERINENADIDIPKGSYNLYKNKSISEAEEIELYLENYSFYIFNYTEKAYQLLDKEYSERRFKSYEKFYEYLVNKQSQLRQIKIVQYQIIEDDENIRYIGTDKYGNYYEIIITDYMEYTIKLDEYTIQDGYEDLSEEEKIKNNAEKFISMINSCDYTNAYNLLEVGFKETNFPIEQSFIDYLKQNFFERNIIVKSTIEGNVCTILMKETLSTKSNRFEKQFKVILGEGEQFSISFNI